MLGLFNQISGEEIEDLYKENQLVSSVLNSITDGFFLVNNDWEVLYWNKSAEDILLIEQKDIIKKNLWDFFVDTKEMAFFINYHRSKKENISIEFEVNYEPKQLWLEMKTYPYHQGLAVYFKNVTFKKTLALEVEYSRVQQEAIINSTPDSIWSVNRNYELLIGNKTYVERVFYATGRSIKPGDNVLEGYSEELVTKRKSYYERALNGETFTIEDTILNNARTAYISLEISFNPIIDSFTKKVIGVACYSRDISERKQYQNLVEKQKETLEERERSLRQVTVELEMVLNSSLDLICSTDENLHFVHVNEACRSLLGYEPHELKGKPYTDFLHPEDYEATKEIAERLFNGGVVTDFRNRFIQKSGRIRNLVWSGRWDNSKKLMFSVGRDASSIVQAEILKAETEKRFAALIQKGADMISILDGKGNYEFVSPNFTQILGHDSTELIGQSVFNLIHPDDAQIARNKLAEILVSGEIKKEELRFRDVHCNYRWIEIVGTNLLQEPYIKGIIINSRDITERKLQEEELRIINTRFDTAINISNEVIWELDLMTNQVFKNKNHEILFGYKEGDSYSATEHWAERIHPDDVERVKENLNAKIQSGDTEPWKEEYRYYRANGEVAIVIDQGVLIKDNGGKPVRMVGSMRDITERKKIENERELIIEELTNSNNDLKQFSFITSHNLRAPLSNILGILNVIDEEGLNDINRQLFELLKTSASQLQETIKDLSNIIVIRNRGNVESEQVNIEQTFDDVRKIYLNTLHDIPYTLKVDFKLKEAHLNKPYLESIFINLVSNAVKYRSKKRVLKMHISTSVGDNGNCIIKVADNGLGLDKTRLKNRLFGMYQRFHENTEGKGLGLFIIKSQVTAMGGSIDMQSEVDKGTTFIITLPIKKTHNGKAVT
jgi:PAS domain S-box-containing protein